MVLTINYSPFLDRTSYFKNKTAVVYRDQRYTYEKFKENVLMQANAFKTEGLSNEDKVAFISRNRPQFLESFFSVPLAGGILVPINFRF